MLIQSISNMNILSVREQNRQNVGKVVSLLSVLGICTDEEEGRSWQQFPRVLIPALSGPANFCSRHSLNFCKKKAFPTSAFRTLPSALPSIGAPFMPTLPINSR